MSTIAAQSGIYGLEKAGSAISNLASDTYELGTATIASVNKVGEAIFGSYEGTVVDSHTEINTEFTTSKDLVTSYDDHANPYADMHVELVGDSFLASAA